MVLLAIVSLVAIPAMITASGAEAWGMIAVGQSIGSVAAVVVAYGWGLSGPAIIARSSAEERRREYSESVVAKLSLFVPIGAAAFGLAYVLGQNYALFAGVAALATASVGLTANWFFIGLTQPYTLLVFETLPRVCGTIAGIVFMFQGASALIGVAWQLGGMTVAFVLSTAWILRSRTGGRPDGGGRRRLWVVLGTQRQGLISTVLSSLYSSTPIILVALIAPGAQPTFAVVEKVQRQVIVGLGPFVTVLQGWVPRARGTRALHRRVTRSVILAAVGSAVLGVIMLIVASELISWLGGGQIRPPVLTLALMAVITAVSLFESVTSKAALAALSRLDLVSRATAVGTLVGLPLVAVGALFAGASGALGGILIGLVVRLLLELAAIRHELQSTAEREDTIPESSIGPEQ